MLEFSLAHDRLKDKNIEVDQSIKSFGQLQSNSVFSFSFEGIYFVDRGYANSVDILLERVFYVITHKARLILLLIVYFCCHA